MLKSTLISEEITILKIENSVAVVGAKWGSELGINGQALELDEGNRLGKKNSMKNSPLF